MSDDAHLGLDVDSRSVVQAAIDLDQLAQAAIKAGEGVDFLSASARVQGALWNDNLREIEGNIFALRAQAAAEEAAAAASGRAGAGYRDNVNNLHNLRFATANVAAQFQDILVTAQMGQSPFTIALQQGTQLSQVMQMMAGGGAGGGILATLRASFMSLFSPVSLLTVGIVGLSAAAIEFATHQLHIGETAEDAAKKEQKFLKDTLAGYDDAQKAAKDLADAQTRMPARVVSNELIANYADLTKRAADFRAQAEQLGPSLSSALSAPDREIGRLLTMFNEGKISASDLQIALNNLSHTDLGILGFTFQGLLSQLQEGAHAAALLRTYLVDVEHMQASVAQDKDLGQVLDQRIQGQRAADSAKVELDAISAKTPAQLAEIARRRETLKLADEQINDTLRQQKIDAAGAQAYREASYAIGESNRQRLQAVNDNVKAAQTELDVVGATARETARLQFLREQMAAAESEAKDRGGSVSPEVRKGIEDAAEQYGLIQEKIKGAQMALEDETPWEKMQRNIAEMSQMLADGAISWDDYAMSVGAATETMVKSYGDAANDVIGNIDKFVSALGLQGEAAFEAQKALSLARAVVSGGEAIVHSYNAGAAIGGPPVGALFAGIAAAATAAQIASIATSTSQSKSISGSAAGATSAPGTAGTLAPNVNTLTIEITGSGNISADEFARQLAAGLADGAHPELSHQITVQRAA